MKQRLRSFVARKTRRPRLAWRVLKGKPVGYRLTVYSDGLEVDWSVYEECQFIGQERRHWPISAKSGAGAQKLRKETSA